MAKISRNEARSKKHLRTRAKIKLGTSKCPRLNVYKSLQNLEAQAIVDAQDGLQANTLVAVSTKDKALKIKYGGNIAAATALGNAMGQALKTKGIKQIVFDRGGFLYHGRVKAFADAVRAQGVKF